MSVENQLEEAAAVDVHVIKSDSLKESRLEEDEDDTQSQIAIANLTENTNDECFSIPNNAVNPGMKNGHDESKAESIRYWFGNLSNAERVAALGFNDESFLSSLIVHSPSPWSVKDDGDVGEYRSTRPFLARSDDFHTNEYQD